MNTVDETVVNAVIVKKTTSTISGTFAIFSVESPNINIPETVSVVMPKAMAVHLGKNTANIFLCCAKLFQVIYMTAQTFCSFFVSFRIKIQ